MGGGQRRFWVVTRLCQQFRSSAALERLADSLSTRLSLLDIAEFGQEQTKLVPRIDDSLSIWSAGIFFHRCLVFLYDFP